MTDVMDADPLAPNATLEVDLEASIGGILNLLAKVAKGDLTHRLESQYPDSHPVGALSHSINAMIEALADARARSEGYVVDLQDKLGAIERQQLAIQELSTPIIEVWNGVLCVPIVGLLDSTRTAEMTSALLAAIVQKKADCALIDITGIDVMDTRVVDHFVRMARAVRLLGAECVLSGVHPNISRTIVQMSIDLHGITTHRTISEALRQFVSSKSADASQNEMRDYVGKGGG
jgi:rsbT co-antagonist protein RsbR